MANNGEENQIPDLPPAAPQRGPQRVPNAVPPAIDLEMPAEVAEVAEVPAEVSVIRQQPARQLGVPRWQPPSIGMIVVTIAMIRGDQMNPDYEQNCETMRVKLQILTSSLTPRGVTPTMPLAEYYRYFRDAIGLMMTILSSRVHNTADIHDNIVRLIRLIGLYQERSPLSISFMEFIVDILVQKFHDENMLDYAVKTLLYWRFNGRRWQMLYRSQRFIESLGGDPFIDNYEGIVVNLRNTLTMLSHTVDMSHIMFMTYLRNVVDMTTTLLQSQELGENLEHIESLHRLIQMVQFPEGDFREFVIAMVSNNMDLENQHGGSDMVFEILALFKLLKHDEWFNHIFQGLLCQNLVEIYPLNLRHAAVNLLVDADLLSLQYTICMYGIYPAHA
jgi:hypothetical protein